MTSKPIFQFFSLTLFFVYCISFSVRHSMTIEDADSGEQETDITEINEAAGLDLFEGDIALPRERNALRNEKRRWKLPIPFILADNLDLNAKGVILKALEGFSLKTCVGFKPYEGEKSFIKFQNLKGCWSFIGNMKNGQNISVGKGCEKKGIVTHELLHALGFYHEQARTDRDDYVKIWWNRIVPDHKKDFKRKSNRFVTDLNTQYDYESMMHYRPSTFSKNEGLPTITAKIPEFNSIIGQRLDFSRTDLQKIYQMYKCTRPLTLLDQCDFESADVCGLVQETKDAADWLHKKTDFKHQDHTLNGKCNDGGYFMFFDTSFGKAGETAVLKSRILHPRRTQQCLQFFFRMTGSPKDRLFIWVMKDDGSGTVRALHKIQTLQGDSDKNWKIAHVILRGQEKFRYLFEGQKGNPEHSSGGILIDDLTLSETRCPNAVWLIHNFSLLLNSSEDYAAKLKSPRFYNPEGYGYGMMLSPRSSGKPDHKKHVLISFHLASGENDDVLEWPALNRQVTITVLDQHSDVKERWSIEKSFTTDSAHVLKGIKNASRWGNPSVLGKFDPSCDCRRGPGLEWRRFVTHEQLRQRNYLKNDDLIILADFEDLTHLKHSERSFMKTWHFSDDFPPRRRKGLAPLDDLSTSLSESHHSKSLLT